MNETRSWVRRARDEPLVGFALIGVLLFVAEHARRAPEDSARRIEIDAAFVEGLRTDAARRTGHPPDAEETDALVRAWAREEALYREARALELDVGDDIVRRRLVQKIELLLAAEAAPDEPGDDALTGYLAAHGETFAAPDRTSITLCFFARELHEDAGAAAAEALATGVTSPCDPYLLGSTFRERTGAQLRAVVGDEAAAWAASAAIGAWGGPFASARGLYLVRVDARAPGGPRPLAEVRDDVRDAVLEEARDAAVRAREDEIVARYEVVGP